ncbi:hypothetical protein D9756_009742 [Leucocoprinus leucothites]|uniref:Conidiation-specific protein 6 n=1 Tax=Leucocoprinus leucothites TaxID=201217 RepID=A0A8H5CWQ4_9AGAR|nr:hypothetical protein D9756_009742 [Leucoagaricus leucothites]
MPEYTSKDPGHVAAGYKATIHNKNTSNEAKEHASEQLDKMGIHEFDQPSQEASTNTRSRSPTKHTADVEGKNEGNVIGGYKATLKNPRVSKEAKQHAETELEDRGVDLEPYEEETKEL